MKIAKALGVNIEDKIILWPEKKWFDPFDKFRVGIFKQIPPDFRVRIMSDIFTKKRRSEIMSHIRPKNTGIEVIFTKALSSELYPEGFRYRKHHKKVFGNPDIVFVSSKIAIFIDGDFWHGKNFNKLRPKPKTEFWIKKIEGNMKRDKKVNRYLRKNGWTVFRLSEKQLKTNLSESIQAIKAELVKKRVF